MILGFKPQFVEPILEGSKIHTIRRDEHDRWKAGKKIDMATGVRTKNYNKFAEKICVSTQTIEIKWKEAIEDQFEGRSVRVFIDAKDVTLNWFDDTTYDTVVDVLSKNDGFSTLRDFFTWFSEDFKGKIIHWTDFKY